MIWLPDESEPAVVVEGDCLDVLRRLPDGCADAVVTDPPYSQTNERYDGPGAISLRPDVWRECYRACGPNAALVAFAGGPTYHRIASAVEAGGWKVRQMWAWVYRDGFITSAYPRDGFDRLAPAMDPIVYATKGKVVLPLEREGDAEWHRPARTRGPMRYSDRASNHGKTTAKGRWPRAVVSDGTPPFEYFDLSRTHGGKTERNGHPNQKPLALMRWLVAKLPGRLVLDPFAGSFTTGIAALDEGRRCIGIEKDPAYADLARRRIAAARESLAVGAA